MRTYLVTGPAVEPVHLDEVKQHCRVTPSDVTDDALLQGYIAAARRAVERHTNRALVSQTWDVKFDAWPADDRLRLPLAPLSSVTSISYVDEAGDSQTWAASNYRVVAPAGPQARPGLVELGYEKTFPSVRAIADAITVRIVAGYGASWNDVPEDLRLAILILVAEFYANPGRTITGTIVNEFPTLREILHGYVVPVV